MTRPKKRSAAGTTFPSDNTSDVAPRTPRIEWIKNPNWTWTLITYLTDHPEFRKNIFSNSTAKEGRAKQIGQPKAHQYAVLAEVIFSKEPTQADSFKANPQSYATSVETRLRRLKNEYAEHLKTLGVTGAHLAPLITKKWPWWAELHAFWCKLPHYNPIVTANSTLGHDSAEDGTVYGSASGAEGTEQSRLLMSGTEMDEVAARGRSVESEPLNDELGVSIQPKPFVGAVSGSTVNTMQFGSPSRGKSVAKNKDAVDKFQNTLSAEAFRIQCERMDHELSMAQAVNKRLKYEFKKKAADHEFRLKELEVNGRLEELKLQIELERFLASRVHPVATHLFTTHVQSESPLNRTTTASESTSVSFDPSFPASCSLFPLQEAFTQPSGIYDLSQTSFDIPFSPTFNIMDMAM